MCPIILESGYTSDAYQGPASARYWSVPDVRSTNPDRFINDTTHKEDASPRMFCCRSSIKQCRFAGKFKFSCDRLQWKTLTRYVMFITFLILLLGLLHISCYLRVLHPLVSVSHFWADLYPVPDFNRVVFVLFCWSCDARQMFCWMQDVRPKLFRRFTNCLCVAVLACLKLGSFRIHVRAV